MNARARPCATALGLWSMATALLADANNPLPHPQRTAMLVRMHSGLEDIAKAAEPSINSWRDLADATNWLQSCLELGWVEDNNRAIDAAKAALLDAKQNYDRHGKLRMNAQSLSAMRNMLEQFQELTGALSAREYWSAVKRTDARVRAIWTGKRRPGDVVVSL